MNRDIDTIIDGLRRDVDAERCTLREDLDGTATFPVTSESLADGVGSLRDETTVVAATSPSVRLLMRTRQPVFVDDCHDAEDVDGSYDDAGFRAMLRTYGGLAGFMVFPLFDEARLFATIAVHRLGKPRPWTAEQRSTGQTAAAEVARLLRSRD